MIRRSYAPLVVVALAALLVTIAALELQQASHEKSLPLSDAAIIREQAAAKHLDPALIAAVIYTESRFEPRPSVAGAQGLMQILPATAYFLAHLSGGYRFTASDLATPKVNLAYGAYYLRYLLDHYEGDETLALAAYNAGLSNVDSWIARDTGAGRHLSVESIPFPETREYVREVLSAQHVYRATYPRALGIA